jgi:hypothetical protein
MIKVVAKPVFVLSGGTGVDAGRRPTVRQIKALVEGALTSLAQLLGQLPPDLGDPERNRGIAALHRRSLSEIE